MPSRSNTGCGRDRDADQKIAGLAAAQARLALPFQPDLLAFGETGRNLDLDLLAVRQLDPLLHAVRGFRQRDGERRRDVGALPAAEVVGLELVAAAPPAAARPAGTPGERLLQDVLETAAEVAARPAAAASERPRAPR